MVNQSHKPNDPTLSDIARSIGTLQTQLGNMQTRLDSVECKLSGVEDRLNGVENRLNSVESQVNDIKTQMVTREEFQKTSFRLESTIRREAGDLGESIASLTSMVGKEFDNLAIARS
jgi:chromosome segregation ATPase